MWQQFSTFSWNKAYHRRSKRPVEEPRLISFGISSFLLDLHFLNNKTTKTINTTTTAKTIPATATPTTRRCLGDGDNTGGNETGDSARWGFEGGRRSFWWSRSDERAWADRTRCRISLNAFMCTHYDLNLITTWKLKLDIKFDVSIQEVRL